MIIQNTQLLLNLCFDDEKMMNNNKLPDTWKKTNLGTIATKVISGGKLFSI